MTKHDDEQVQGSNRRHFEGKVSCFLFASALFKPITKFIINKIVNRIL